MDTPVLVGSWQTKGNLAPDVDFIGSHGSLNALFQHYSKTQFAPCIGQRPLDDSHLVYKTNARILEGEIAWPGTSARRIQEWCECKLDRTWSPFGFVYMAPDVVLFTLKLSHRFRDSIHFDKTRKDILEFRSRGYSEDNLSPELKEILALRIAELPDTKVNLRVSRDEFFSDDGVDYVYEHDLIHESIALDRVPAYEMVKSSDSEVFMTRAEFEAAPRSIRINCVLEEAMVLALERCIIPRGKLYTANQMELDSAMDLSLRKICTRITGGYFREFAWENLDVIRTIYAGMGIDYARKMRENFNVNR